MESKEALGNLRFNVSMSQDLNYKENNDLCDIIEKDLEVLEILKNHFIRFYDFSTNKDTFYMQFNKLRKDRDADNLLRWLENDK